MAVPPSKYNQPFYILPASGQDEGDCCTLARQDVPMWHGHIGLAPCLRSRRGKDWILLP
jgi:hypothetical protein